MALAPRWTGRPRRALFGSGSGRYHHTSSPGELRADRARTWAPAWRSAAEGCGLARTVHVAAGVTSVIPTLTSVDLRDDGSTVLRVRALPGQLVADYLAAAPRLAQAMRAVRVQVSTAHDGAIVVLTLLDHDPLAAPVRHRPDAPAGLLGVVEDGRRLAIPWARRGHTLVQGQTGSGKSVWTYGQLADAAADPGVLVTGLDPSGLLWRPFTGSRHAPWQVSGVGGELADHVELLERLVGEMDARIAAMPADRDAVETGPDLPVLLVVLEEYAGLLRVADVTDKRLGQRIRALVARLLSEGRKAGVRVLLVVQRADAAVVDGLVRAQCALRLSFSVDSAEAVRMLHPAVPVDASDVLAAPPGVALVTRPGTPLERLRAPLLDYRRYAELVAAAPAWDPS